MSKQFGAHEICVLCAKPDELRPVLEVFARQFERGHGNHLTQQVFKVPSKYGSDGVDLTVLVATCAGMGHMYAAVRTAQLITSHQPHFMIFLGTAASLRPSQIQIGDVVIPRKAISRVYEKISEKGQFDYESRVREVGFGEHFFSDNILVSDISTVDCSPDAMGIVARLEVDRLPLINGATGDVTIGSEVIPLRSPKIHEDVDIFSCGMVVDSIGYREFLIKIADQNMRKAGIIDMESTGFFHAISASSRSGVGSNTEGLMIRGISDYAGRKQQTENLPTEWRKLCVSNAAIVAAELVRLLAGI